VDLLHDESLETGNEVDVKTECLTAKRLTDVVDGWTLEERHFNLFDVRKRQLQFELEAHQAREGHVLDNDIQALAHETLADADFKNNFRVDFILDLASSEVERVLGGKAELPVHQDDIVLGLGIRLDVLEARGLCAENKRLHLEAVKERRGRSRENLVDRANNGVA
jgi:hypothetical protein